MPSKQNNPYQKNISFNKQMTNIMRKVARALKQGDDTEAVRLFVEGQKDLVVPADVELPGYLAKTFGIDVTSKLLKAFVRFPCGYRQGKNVAVYPAQFLHLGRKNREPTKKPFPGERNVD